MARKKAPVASPIGQQDALSVMNALNKQIGGSANVIDFEDAQGWDSISTGDMGFDELLKGGIPRGLITELYGTESGGKTTLALSIARECIRGGGKVLYIDVERSLSPADVARFHFPKQDPANPSFFHLKPNNAEEALEYIKEASKTGVFDLIVLDSVAALSPKGELDAKIEDQRVAEQARIMSRALRQIVPAAGNTNTAIIFINQLREKVGVMFGSPITTPGGKALKFYDSLRIDIAPLSKEHKLDKATGNIALAAARCKIVKSKICPAQREAIIYLSLGYRNEWGVSNAQGLLSAAEKYGVLIKVGGGHYVVAETGEKAARGWENLYSRICDDEEFRNEIAAGVVTARADYNEDEDEADDGGEDE